VTRTAPRGRTAARTVVPLLAGATAAAAGVLLLGWPHRPPLPGRAGELAAVVLVAVAVLLVFVPALPAWRRSDLARDRVAVAARGERPLRRAAQVPAPRIAPDLAGRAAQRSLFEPAR
jgi:hypothetical protein